jgi:hypothetical protein
MKNLSENIPDDKPLWQLTVGEFRVLVATVSHPTTNDDAPTSAEAIAKLYPNATKGWLKGHVEAEGRGARQQLLYRPSKVRAVLEAAPVAPKLPKKREIVGINEDPILAMIRHKELIPARGRR